MKEWLLTYLDSFLGPNAAFWVSEIVVALAGIVGLTACLMLGVAYLTYAERRVIGGMQGRIGPNRVGFWGLLQPIADGFKLLTKEIIFPAQASRALFLVAPVISITTALAVWAVIPFSADLVLADINAGLLYVLALSSLGVYGIVVAGWASNSKYAFLGAMRAAAQVISYEISMSLAVVCVLMVAGSLNLSDIVFSQTVGYFHEMGLRFLSWNWLPLFPMFLVYLISGVAETNRHPFDMAEGESEIVAGFHVEYSGMAFAIFFLAEYANMILISALTVVLFLGGWDAPFSGLYFVPDMVWFVLKIVLVLFLFLWIRATFPRYRYDQVMRLGWKVFIPVTLFWFLLVGGWMLSPISIW